MVADDYGPQGRSAWLDVDWTEHARWVEVDGRAVNLVDWGEGPPLVLVHGLGGCWQNWLENIPEFARDHRVVAVDLPGFGSSEMPDEKISIAGYGRWLDRLLDVLEIEAATVVGNSMGGFIAAETAIKFPHRVERLVLVSAAGLTVEYMRNERGMQVLEFAENVLQFTVTRFIARAAWLTPRPRGKALLLWFVAAHPSKLPAPLVAEQVAAAGKPGFVPALDALTSYPIRSRLGDIGCPTLVIWGEKDVLVPLRDAYEFHRLIPDSDLRVYDDTGHVPMMERPARFNADLRAFLPEPAPSGLAVSRGS